MGGYGSGSRSTRKVTVEECLTADISRLLKPDITQKSTVWGWIEWKNRAGETLSSVNFYLDSGRDTSATLRLSYQWGSAEERIPIEEPIPMVATRPYFGGLRWWFICPLIISGRVCQRRVRRLHLPPGGRYFGCRSCYNLTYDSVRTHDGRLSWLARHPGELLAALKSKNPSKSFLGFRAALKAEDYQ